jgi:hypothetical protein
MSICRGFNKHILEEFVRQVSYLPEQIMVLLVLLHFQTSNFSNKSNNQMHQFHRFIACCLNRAQHDSGVLTPTIKSSTNAVVASGFTFGAW